MYESKPYKLEENRENKRRAKLTKISYISIADSPRELIIESTRLTRYIWDSEALIYGYRSIAFTTKSERFSNQVKENLHRVLETFGQSHSVCLHNKNHKNKNNVCGCKRGSKKNEVICFLHLYLKIICAYPEYLFVV